MYDVTGAGRSCRKHTRRIRKREQAKTTTERGLGILSDRVHATRLAVIHIRVNVDVSEVVRKCLDGPQTFPA